MTEQQFADPAEVARLAAGRASAVHPKVGPVFETAVWGWLPKLGGKVVRLEGGPENGYPTRQSAVDAAREFRDLCRAAATVPAPLTLVPTEMASYCRVAFQDVWNWLHGRGAWDANSEVVTISFTVERKNADGSGSPSGLGSSLQIEIRCPKTSDSASAGHF